MWPSVAFEGEAWRHSNPHYDPLSGEGARRQGEGSIVPGFPRLHAVRNSLTHPRKRLKPHQTVVVHFQG